MDMLPRFVFTSCKLVSVVAKGSTIVFNNTTILRMRAAGFVFAVPKGGELAYTYVVSLLPKANGTNRGGECL